MKCIACKNMHCQDTIPKILRNKYSQKSNCAATVPISKFICLWLWEIYIFSQSICLYAAGKYVDRSWEYIYRSQTQECGNWDWGRAIPRKGIHKWDFCCSVVAEGDCAYTTSRRYIRYLYVLSPGLSICIGDRKLFVLPGAVLFDPLDLCWNF